MFEYPAIQCKSHGHDTVLPSLTNDHGLYYPNIANAFVRCRTLNIPFDPIGQGATLLDTYLAIPVTN